MKKFPIISFRHFEGSGPLSIYWYDGPYGAAIEATQGSGVSWHAPNGELLGVEFDNVFFNKDHQSLELFNKIIIEIKISKGVVTFNLISPNQKKKASNE
jgi:hypothetical protein